VPPIPPAATLPDAPRLHEPHREDQEARPGEGRREEARPTMVPERLAIVVDGDLPAGLAANAAAVLALTLGRHTEGVLGPDVPDADGRLHRGITALNVPILRATPGALRDIVLAAAVADDVVTVDFCAEAQSARVYSEYTAKLAATGTSDLGYVGVGLAGSKKAVNRLVGSLPLYR
jgi:hypothetical protein